MKEKITRFDNGEYDISDLKSLINLEGKELQINCKRSRVKLINYKDKKIIIKEPLSKDKKIEVRLSTLFRKSFAYSSLKSMGILKNMGIETNKPIMCLELKRFGMVYKTYMFFEYLEGERANTEDKEEILLLIQKIHKKGYCHGDAQSGNFLKTKRGIGTIDIRLKKKTFGKTSEYLEYLKFCGGKDIENYVETNNFFYRIATYCYTRKKIRKLKKKKKIRK